MQDAPPQPSLSTQRLLLRAFTLADAPAVQQLVDDPEIASTTLLIPYPYPPGAATIWIETHAMSWEYARVANFAVVELASGRLVGSMSLTPEEPHFRAELGYWIGRPYWNRGYATEAARAAIDFAFASLGMQRVFAMHFTRNPASGRVLVKAGMRHEGILRGHAAKGDAREDCEVYGILASDRPKT